MRCTKCQGLVLNEYGDVRCLNCVNRPCQVLREPERAPQGRRSRCKDCQNEAEPGRNHCRPHLEYFVEYTRKRKAKLDEARLLILEEMR